MSFLLLNHRVTLKQHQLEVKLNPDKISPIKSQINLKPFILLLDFYESQQYYLLIYRKTKPVKGPYF